jgi:hypothetical protein
MERKNAIEGVFDRFFPWQQAGLLLITEKAEQYPRQQI